MKNLITFFVFAVLLLIAITCNSCSRRSHCPTYSQTDNVEQWADDVLSKKISPAEFNDLVKAQLSLVKVTELNQSGK